MANLLLSLCTKIDRLICACSNAFCRIPRWKTTAGDGNTVDVSFVDVFDCLRLNVSSVPCIVTLSKVSYIFVYLL